MASLLDAVTVLQNIVKAFNNFTYSNVQLSGSSNTQNLTAMTLVKNTTGRILAVSVNTAGTTTGGLYDAATTAAANSTNLLVTVPNTVGVFTANMTFKNGLVYIPGTAQATAICYS
jgi:hypothetical protein